MALLTNGFIEINGNFINCDSVSFNPGQSVDNLADSGAATATTATSKEIRPTFSATTRDINIMELGLNYTVNSMTSKPVNVYWTLTTDEGVRAASGHEKYAMTKGCFTWNTLSVGQGGEMVSTFTFYPSSTDGFAQPFTRTTVATPTRSAQLEVLTLGAVSLSTNAGSGTLTKVKSVNFDFGQNIEQDISSGHVYPTECTLMTQSPVATVTTANPIQLETLITAKVSPLTSTGLVVNLAETLNRVAVSASDYTISAPIGVASIDEKSGNQGSIVTQSFRVAITSNLSDDPVTVS